MKPIEEQRPQMPAPEPAEEETGGILSRIKGGVARVAIGIVVFLLICGVTFNFAINTTSNALSATGPAPLIALTPTPASEPVQLGYQTQTEAASNCASDETPIALWRGGQVVGHACNKDMTRKAYGSAEAAKEACGGNFKGVRGGPWNTVFEGYICQ